MPILKSMMHTTTLPDIPRLKLFPSGDIVSTTLKYYLDPAVKSLGQHANGLHARAFRMELLHLKNLPLHGDGDRLHAIQRAEFCEDMRGVNLDCPFRYAQGGSDLLVALALADKSQHFQLTR